MANEVVVQEEQKPQTNMVSKYQSETFWTGGLMVNSGLTELDLFNAGDNEVPLFDYLQKHENQIEVVGFYARWCDNIAGTEGYQVVLITPNKEAVRCSAQILIGRFRAMFSLLGLPEKWKHPLKLKLKNITVSRGKSYGVEALNNPNK